jgi:isopropylmalate/homocitrate/citramalate synthase
LSVVVCEVGPRDGLQNEERLLEPSIRAELVRRLAKAGLERIEAVSFVNPKLVPQMAGAEEVVDALQPPPGNVVLAGLVLNEKGYQRLIAAGLPEAHYALAATEEFNRRNQNESVDESLATAERILTRSRDDGIRVTVTIGVSFGCPFEGPVDPGRVLSIAERLAGMGAAEISFADTVGVGVPTQASHLVSRAVEFGVPVGVHLHNTRNTGLANVYAALEAGATIFDASAGGTGGCPFAPRATGNIATEDLVYMLHHMGVVTSVNLDALIEIAQWLSSKLDRTLPGQVHRAGTWPD